MDGLFSPITVRGHKIKNRIVMAPMVCFGYAGGDGKVTEKNLEHYRARAKGGVGLIIVEATCVARLGRLSPNQLGLWGDEHIEGFKKIAEACHQWGAKVLVQIHHAGLAGHRDVATEFLSSSDFQGAIRGAAEARARGMSLAEIEQVESDFTDAALRAKKAGLDGVELHGAHGYLLNQFFSPLINKRQDRYGGGAENRVRIAGEIIARIRRSAGADFLVTCRMGCNEPGLPEGIEIARQLEKAGVDILHVSSGMTTAFGPGVESTLSPPQDFKYSWLVYGGSQIKKSVKVPVIVVGGIRTPQQASYLVEKDFGDFAALAKGLLVDAEWANKARQQVEVLTCLDCKICGYFRRGATTGEGCPREKEKAKWSPAKKA